MASLRIFIAAIAAVTLVMTQVYAVPIIVTVTLDACSAAATAPISIVVSDLALPVNGGATELPSPLSNLTLKYVALGRGFQNYTCANSSALPVSNGAVATLYDVSSMVSASSSAADKFPAIAVYQPIQPSGASPLTLTAAYQIPAVHEAFPVLGYHYFDSTATPTFNLSSTRSHALLYGKKIADIKAPSTASVGMAGTGAVDWLDLIAKKGSVGLGQVYRVSTAGGNPPGTCAGQDADGSGAGSVVIDYSALYWFYG